jgi:glycosyltransferase involved in cell wall biosynthesis
MGSSKQRLLIFVIAYYAEATLRRVLERIPSSIFDEYDCELLVVDDASSDRTFEIGRMYQIEHREIRMTVLRNEYNQGYGGDQKVGYSYAIREGFDFVAILHGDGTYAPEELPRLVAPLRDGEADAVLGSRMISAFGGMPMPLYKLAGNRILTAVQNVLLGTRFTDLHSGYRVYSVEALETIRFQLNTNDFHFDTEIVLQLLNARVRIRELPVPIYHGAEIGPLNGVRYAQQVMISTMRNVAHRAGLLHQRALDPVPPKGYSPYTLKLGYPSSHTYALEAVPAGAKVLDLGAGPGGVARLFALKGCEVTVVDRNPPAEAGPGVEVLQADLDAERFDFDVRKYDYLLLLDVLEHLKEPERFLEELRRRFDHRPKTLVLTTPNVGFFIQRGMLLLGQFNYGKAGILDRTHTRLFTFRSLRRLLRETGFRIKAIRGIPAPFPKVFGPGWCGRIATALNVALICISKTLFSYQIMVVAEGTPDIDFLLANAKQKSAYDLQVAHRSAPQRARWDADQDEKGAAPES